MLLCSSILHDNKGKFLHGKVGKYWKRAVESPSLEGFQALWRWHLGTGSVLALAVLGMVGFDLRGLFQPKAFQDSMKSPYFYGSRAQQRTQCCSWYNFSDLYNKANFIGKKYLIFNWEL